MSRFKRSKHRGSKRAAILITAAGVILAVILVGPWIGATASRKASSLATQAQDETRSGNLNQAVVDLEVGSALSPSNHQIIQQLADLYVRRNEPDDAIRTLKRLPKGEGNLQIAKLQRQSGRLDQALSMLNEAIKSRPSNQLLRAKSEVQLEQGREDEAAASAKEALNYQTANAETQIQLGLCYALVNKTDEQAALRSSVSSSETSQALEQAQSGKTALAYLLYSRGLLRSSERVLKNIATLNTPATRLLGRINLTLASNDPSRINQAETYLIKAALADPANLEGHQLLQQVYQKEGKTAESTHQTDLIQQLQSGKVQAAS